MQTEQEDGNILGVLKDVDFMIMGGGQRRWKEVNIAKQRAYALL